MAKQKIFRIGTRASNDIVINDPNNFVSKVHATLTHQGGESYLLEDHSSNGTWVNGKEYHRSSVYVQKGDHIKFANQVDLDWARVTSTTSSNSSFKWWYATIPLLILVLGVVGLWKKDEISCMIKRDCDALPPKCSPCTPPLIEEAYEKSVAMIAMTYKWKLMDKINNRPILYVGLDSDAIRRGEEAGIVPRNPESEEDLTPFLTFGTGFYIKTDIEGYEDGMLVTNRHVVKKIYDDYERRDLGPAISGAMDKIEQEEQKRLLAARGTMRDSDIEWIPDFDYIYVAPYNSSFNLGDDLLDQIREVKNKFRSADLIYHSSKYDLALIKRQDGTPELSVEIPQVAFKTEGRKGIESSTNATTIGFPIGSYPWNTIVRTGQTGGASQIVFQTRVGRLGTPNAQGFIFDNAAKGGQSGSPVFNEKGELIGVVYAVDGNSNTQCVHAREIVNELLLPLAATVN